MIGWHFLRRRHDDTAELRDEVIRLGTANILLANELEHARRPKRERRKDAADIRAAKEAMTARLVAENKAAKERRFQELAPVLFRGLAG